MTPERWRKVETIFHAALKLHDEDALARYLDEVCRDDDELRREVLTLVEAHGRAEIEEFASPLFSQEALVTNDDSDQKRQLLKQGETVGSYRVLSLLGTGGMGEVYLARDLRLGRRVALKVLPLHFTAHQDRVRRFQQEARVVSALNHPNIITVYEVGACGDQHFLATEFVDGVTLRQHLTQARMTLPEIIDVGMQIAAALAVAHAAGIVHRDIKPENIMLRRDGLIKVLDFGLAKTTSEYNKVASANSQVVTLVNIPTQMGMILGTLNYMSPEQTRGLTVDARADVWSLGVVLYEMIAGKVPFAAATPSDLIIQILEHEPQSLADCAPETPAALQQIISKALCKEQSQRFQTAEELLRSLRELRLSQVVDNRKFQPKFINEFRAGSAYKTAKVEETNYLPATTKENSFAPLTVMFSRFVSTISSVNKNTFLVLCCASIVIVAALLLGLLYIFQTRQPQARTAFQQIEMKRLTDTGTARDAAVSLDGRNAVYVVEEAGQQSLWGTQTAVTGSRYLIVPPSAVQYKGLTFTPSGDYIYYVASENEKLSSALYKVPAQGGASRKLIDGVVTSVTFSPDSQRIAFISEPAPSEYSLTVANADGSGRSVLATRRLPEFFRESAWSPDGEVIACIAGSYMEGFYMTLVAVSVNDGTERPMTDERWWWIKRPAWLGDGSGLVIAAGERISGANKQVWLINYPDGGTRRITNELNNYGGVTSTADSSALVTVRTTQLASLWVEAERGDNASMRPATSGKYNMDYDVSWLPNGKLVLSSYVGEANNIWVVDDSGANLRMLTADAGINNYPSASPDGRYIVFGSNRSGKFNIWRMDNDGGNPRHLTSGSSDWFPDCSPDGQWVIYSSIENGKATLWRVNINGGEPTQVSDLNVWQASFSPDGRSIAGYLYEEQTQEEQTPQWRLVVFPFVGGSPMKTFDAPQHEWRFVRWMPSGDALAYIDVQGGVANLWSQPLTGGVAKQLTHLTSDYVFSFAWSKDGGRLACSRGNLSGDVIMIRNRDSIEKKSLYHRLFGKR